MKLVRQLVNPAVLAMDAYPVPSAENLVKLDAMENPYRWPAAVVAEWQSILGQVAVNRYPDADASLLKKKLRGVLQLPADMELLLGNGSDELIQLLAMAVSRPDRVVMSPEPGFVMYRLISRFVQMAYQPMALDPDDFSLNRERVLAAVAEHRPALLFIAYPNNPTGNLFDRETIREIIAAAPGLVVIDEAYHAFAGDSFLDCLGEFDNLLILRTLSKSGLAGLRLGYLVGSPEWIHELNKLRLPYNINALTQASATFILDRQKMLDSQSQQICRDRELLYQALQAMDGIHAWPSRANFLMFRCLEKDADAIYAGLKQQGILIKNLHGSQPGLQDCLRVTVGKAEENEHFVKSLAGLL